MPRAKYNAHAAVWDSKMHGKYIYLACEDGSVKVLKVKKTKIEYVRHLVKSESKALSIELVRNGIDEKSIVKSLFVGYADSSIRKWDLQTGNSVLHFEKLTKKAQKKVGSCFIWQLKIFKGFIISGDSQGDVTVWDSEFGTLVKQFKHLKGDINALEINEEYSTVYASGADSRVFVIQLKDEREWIFASIFRGQSHDIKSLLLLSNK